MDCLCYAKALKNLYIVIGLSSTWMDCLCSSRQRLLKNLFIIKAKNKLIYYHWTLGGKLKGYEIDADHSIPSEIHLMLKLFEVTGFWGHSNGRASLSSL